MADFYSHAREGRDMLGRIISQAETDFYSHAREGRDKKQLAALRDIQISTHTPARGVTLQFLEEQDKNGISTHTPARGVTPIFCILGRSRHHITQGGLIFFNDS